MMTFLDKYRDVGLLLLRIGIGLMYMVTHGGPKLLGGPPLWGKVGGAMGYLGIHFAPTFWGFMAMFSEFFGAFLFLLGLFFRPACFLLLATMFVASFQHLAKGDGLSIASHAIELGIVFLAMIFIGPGRFSLEALLIRKKAK